MKLSDENFQAFKAEIVAVCDKYGIELSGTCWSEGITGEILVAPKGELPECETFNFVYEKVVGENAYAKLYNYFAYEEGKTIS